MGEPVGSLLEVRLVLEPEPEADPEEVDGLGRQFQGRLRALDLESVRGVHGTSAPSGAKGLDSSTVEWLVTLTSSGGALATLIGTVREWLSRRGAGHAVTVTLDGDTIELTSATTDQQAQLVAAFLRQHGGA